eukprot:7913158-Pyramimonas_sp.AAC.1
MLALAAPQVRSGGVPLAWCPTCRVRARARPWWAGRATTSCSSCPWSSGSPSGSASFPTPT